MSEEQKAKYEEAAKEYAKKEYGSTWITVFEQKDFLAGTEHAHPIGFNLGKEEGKVEGWNDCIKMIEEERNILQNTGSLMWHKPDEQKKTLQISECLSITLKYITELQKLRK